MAQVKLLKIASDGVPLEFNSTSDDITLNSFTVQGGGPVLSGTGLDLNNQDLSDTKNLLFNAPSTGYINATAGNLIIDDLMAKERSNVMTTAGDVLFPTITDVAGEVDAFRLPQLAGAPTATPTASGEGFIVWDSTNKTIYAWNGTVWDDIGTAVSAENIINSYTAAVTLAARDAVYISAADSVSKALGDATSKAYCIGFASAGAVATNPVNIKSQGVLTGFTGLTAASRYYLDTSTAGAITSTIPTGTGNTIVQVGYAKSTTALDIQILQLGRRA
jgi:hypothetical protein